MIKMGEQENVRFWPFVPKKYILREDKVGRIVPRTHRRRLFPLRTRRNLAERVTNMQCDLFQLLGHADDQQPVDLHSIAVTSVEHDNRELETETSVLSEISEEVAELLLPVPSAVQRSKICTLGDYLDRALKGHVKISGGKEQHGILRHKGRLGKKNGTYLGFQLQVRYQITNSR